MQTNQSIGRELNWIDSFYESLEFFFWEPQHLGRKKDPESTFNSLDKVAIHLRKMEVTLNQNLHQFFLLAPKSLASQLFKKHFHEILDHKFFLAGRDVDKEFRLENLVQPDLLFISADQVVSLEMKLGAKTSIDQILKYALLSLAIEIKTNKRLDHFLIFLGPKDFSDLWREKFSSAESLKEALKQIDDHFYDKLPDHLQEHIQRFQEILKSLRVSFLNYKSLSTFLEEVKPDCTDLSQGAEVFRNLCNGLINEISHRKLNA